MPQPERIHLLLDSPRCDRDPVGQIDVSLVSHNGVMAQVEVIHDQLLRPMLIRIFVVCGGTVPGLSLTQMKFAAAGASMLETLRAVPDLQPRRAFFRTQGDATLALLARCEHDIPFYGRHTVWSRQNAYGQCAETVEILVPEFY